jgi:glucose/arabinose dehydrogenase
MAGLVHARYAPARVPAAIVPEPTVSRVPRLSGFAWTLLALLAAVALGGALLHAFRFRAPAAGALSGRLENAYPKLRPFRYPVWFGHAGDGSGRVFVLEKHGLIHVFRHDPEVTATKPFLDLTDVVYEGHQEEGLLGLAFDLEFRRNGHCYVHYSRRPDPRGPRLARLARFTVDPRDADRLARDSELVLLEQPRPWGNHTGGCVTFGPDGHLYFSLGDGGSAGDPNGNGQSLATLLGKIGRIDVRRARPDAPYAIPADNPFREQPGARPEIWALGLRNAWRFAFDPATGDCWAGDVGQNRQEELDLVVRGGNYGWRAFEGDLDFDPALATASARRAMRFPVLTYGRDQGQSVTGGLVYRGTRQPLLQGRYLYADFASTFLWALDWDREAGRVRANDFLARTGVLIASFGEAPDGEVCTVAFDGRIYRVVAERR